MCVTIFWMYHNQLVSFAMVSIFHSLRIASEDVVVSFLKSNKALIGSRAIHGGPKRAHIAAVRPFHSKLPRPPTQSFNRGSETRKCSGHACSLYFQNELCSNLVGTQAFQPTKAMGLPATICKTPDPQQTSRRSSQCSPQSLVQILRQLALLNPLTADNSFSKRAQFLSPSGTDTTCSSHCIKSAFPPTERASVWLRIREK